MLNVHISTCLVNQLALNFNKCLLDFLVWVGTGLKPGRLVLWFGYGSNPFKLMLKKYFHTFLVCVVLEIEPRASDVLGRCSTVATHLAQDVEM